MLDENENPASGETSEKTRPAQKAIDGPVATTVTATTTTRRRSAGRPAGPPAAVESDIFAVPDMKKPKAAKKAAAKPKSADQPDAGTAQEPAKKPAAKRQPAKNDAVGDGPTEKQPAKKTQAKKSQTKTPENSATDAHNDSTESEFTKTRDSKGQSKTQAAKAQPAKESKKAKKAAATKSEDGAESSNAASTDQPQVVAGGLLFQAPPAELLPPRTQPEPVSHDAQDTQDNHDDDSDGSPKRRRRSRGGRRRNKNGDGDNTTDSTDESNTDDSSDDSNGDDNNNGSSRRRRRRARAGEDATTSPDDPDNTVVKVRDGRSVEDEITGVTGSTRLEAKKQRRREGREAGRRRAPIISEAEFLARRESVDRQMIVRQSADYTQIAVLEDKMLVEHYVARESQTSLIGNVYLGKVQNVLPSMEAAFVDIGAGRNAVIYAGEVDWSGVENGKARKIEEALEPGQQILVQVSKDPVGQKGARLTSQISLPGRFLVYVPGGGSNGISRKLPDTERARLKALLKEVLPDDAGVIVRTAAEGASEEQLTRDVAALKARWDDIDQKSKSAKAPELLYAEPDVVIKVVRDLFNEDFASLIVEGDDAWDNIEAYVSHVAPDLRDRLTRWEKPEGENAPADAFAEFRIDEQIHKALDRKVWLPSGGSLVIDRTEAMTVVDVNTGKFTGSGGNLEETVTKNNLEAAEEIVRQLRLRDIGGIIVIDFIDMVLESNRDLVLRRLVECLGRDRTRHQVAEVTSLGLVQMTRKRLSTGLVESFSVECEHCKGRGLVIANEPVERKDEPRNTRGRRGRGNSGNNGNNNGGNQRRNRHDNKADDKTQPNDDAKSGSKDDAEHQSKDEAKDQAKDAGSASHSGNESTPVLTDEASTP